jgi:hypothetical protein
MILGWGWNIARMEHTKITHKTLARKAYWNEAILKAKGEVRGNIETDVRGREFFKVAWLEYV